MPVTWSIITAPSGMTINSTTGVVTWSDPVASASPYEVTIQATNSAGSDDETWYLTVNVDTPDVVGSTYQEAENAILSSNLNIGDITYAVSETIAEGNIITQSPVAHSSSPYASPVDLEISLGIYPNPDVNRDGQINILDVQDLGLHWLEINCIEPSYCEHADVDWNGKVNILDFALIAHYWLEGATTYDLTQTVTYNNETITLQLNKENLRGSNFELWAQNSIGGYDVIVPVEERSYIGIVEEYLGAVACGIIQDDGVFRGAVYFDRGKAWYILGDSVVDTQDDTAPVFAYPSFTVTPDHAGTIMYAFDVGIDVDYDFFNQVSGNDADKTFELIEYNICLVRTIYMRDALLKLDLGRVIIRTNSEHDPYTDLTQNDYFFAVRTEWNTNHTDADRDLVAGISPTVGTAGLAFGGSIGSTTSGYLVSISSAEGIFHHIIRHLMGHSWGLGDLEGNAPEGRTINSGNQLARYSGPEVEEILSERDQKLSFLQDIGTYILTDLPPYASLDSGEFTQTITTSLIFDVLANDHDANGHAIVLDSYDIMSANGGTISQQGQNLVYIAPVSYSGVDYFMYKIIDSSGQTATGVVIINVLLP